MENKNEDTGVVNFTSDGSQLSSVRATPDSDFDPQALSFEPTQVEMSPSVPAARRRPDGMSLWARRGALGLVGVVLVTGLIWALAGSARRQVANITPNDPSSQYTSVDIPLGTLSASGIDFSQIQTVGINGTLELNGDLVVTPSLQPATPKPGQIYYDKNTHLLAYYNGSVFVSLPPENKGVESLGGLNGQITVGTGLVAVGGQLVNTGVLSVQGLAGDVTLAAGNGIVINGTTITNSGIVSVTSSTPALTVSNDGNGNITLTGSGSGTVSSPGGTAGRFAKFTGAQTIADAVLSETGTTVTVNGDLSVTGGVSLSTALTVSNGGSGATSLTANGVVIGHGTSALTAVAAGGPGLCLLSTAGAPAFAACPSAGGVTSLNSLSGAIAIANASGIGSTITIDDATTAAKGIASFNATNFSVSGGAVNTIQNINSAATPTFAGVNTNSVTPSAALTVGSTGQTALLQGSTVTVTSNSGGDVVLTSADQIRLTGFNCTAFTNGGTLTTDASGNLACANDDGGAGGVSSLNSLTGALTLAGTAGQITVNDNGTDTVTLALNAAVTLQGNTFNGANQLVQLNASTELPAVSGVNLTALNATQLTSGTVPAARISGSYTGLTGVGTIGTGTWQGTAVGISYGGTGAATSQGAINNISQLTTEGDLLYHNGTNSTRLARGSDQQCLISTASSIMWSSCSSGGGLTGSGSSGQVAFFNGTGSITSDADLLFNGTTLTVNTLDVTNNATIGGTLAVEGSSLTLGTVGPAGTTGLLVFNNATNSNTATIQSGTTGTSYALTLPTAVGSANQCLKAQNGTGTLFWDDCEGGSGGVSGVSDVNGLGGSLTVQGTANRITVNDNGADTITLDVGTNVTVQGNTFNGANQLVQLNASTELPAVSGVNLTALNASNLASGTVLSARVSGSYTGITGVGTIGTGTWQGTAVADTYVADNLTISSSGTVDWTALANYPTGCSAGQAVTAVGDTLTCGAFAAASGSSSYINNTTTLQTSANLNIQTAATTSVTANFQALASQTADIIRVRNSADTVTVFAVNPAGDVTATSFTGTGAGLTTLNASNLASGTVPSGVVSGSYTGITGTGALGAGSITSGFGAIDIGTDSLQGGTATLTGANTLTLGTTGTNTGSVLFKGSTAASGTITLTLVTNNPTNNTISLPNETGTVCTTGSVCAGYQASGSYANQQLSNLSGTVAINTSLLSGSATIDLGSNANPFRDLYLGGTSTTNFRFTGTASAARTITLDNLSGRLALVQTAGSSTAQTGDLNVDGTLIAGTALQGPLVQTADVTGASSALTVRSGNSTSSGSTGAVTIATGNAASGTAGNISLDVGTSTSGNGSILIGTAARTQTITIGNSTGGAIRVGQNGGTLQLDGTNFDLATSGQITLSGGLSPDITTAGAGTATAITMQPGTATAGSGTGASLTLKAGNQSGNGGTGGATSLQGGNGSGTGTTFGGAVSIDGGTGTFTGAVNLATNVSSAVNIGSTTSTNTITIGQSTASNTINIGNGIVTSGNSQTVNIASLATGTGTTNVTIGSGNGASNTSIYGGTSFLSFYTGNTNAASTTSGNITLLTGDANGSTSNSGSIFLNVGTATGTEGSIGIGTTRASAVTLGNTNGSSSTTLQSGTGNINLNAGSSGDVIATLDADTNFQLNASSINANINPFAVAATYTGDQTSNTVDVTVTNNSSASTGTLYGLSVNNADNSTNTGVLDAIARFVNNQGTETVPDAVLIQNSATSGTVTNGLRVSQGAAGTTTNGIQVIQSAGTLSNGLRLGGTMTNGIYFDSLTATADIRKDTTGFTIDLNNASDSTLTVTNAGAGVASISLEAGGAYTGIGALVVSSGGSSGLTLNSASGRVSVATGDFLSLGISGVSGAAAGDIWYDTSDGKFKVNEAGSTKILCNKTDLACGAGATTPLQTAYNDDVDGSDAIITLSDEDDSIIIRNPNDSANDTDSAFLFKVDQALATGTQDALVVESLGTGNLLRITDMTSTAADVLTIANGGGATFKAQTNAANTFRVQNSSGTDFINLNTSTSTLTLGDSGTSTTTLQAGSGGLSLTSGANIVLGTSNTTGTLLVLDDKTDSGDPTGVAGGMYYNSNLKVFRCYDTYWRDCMATTRTTYKYTTEMASATGDNEFTFDANGGDTDQGTNGGVTGHPGIVIMGTQDAQNNWIYAGSRNGTLLRLGNGDYWRYETVMRIPVLSNNDGTNGYTYRLGFIDGVDEGGNPEDMVDGCYFKYTHNINSGKWQGVCMNGGTAGTPCDTGITVGANTWYRLTLAVNSAGNSVDFMTDGVSRCQVTTGIPTGSGVLTGWGVAINKDSGSTASGDIHLDYISVEGQMGTSR